MIAAEQKIWNDVLHKVRAVNDHNGDFKITDVAFETQDCGKTTLCILRTEVLTPPNSHNCQFKRNQLNVGVAKLNPLDEFDLEVGMKLSLSRAIQYAFEDKKKTYYIDYMRSNNGVDIDILRSFGNDGYMDALLLSLQNVVAKIERETVIGLNRLGFFAYE